MTIEKIALYIHIPFCRKKCAYCDFYSVAYQRDLAKRYIDTLTWQINKFKDEGFTFTTVYIGGGTPSVLDNDLLEKLLKNLNLKDTEEATLEANPESLDKSKLMLLYSAGISRLSIGAQSFDNQALQFLGRIHNREDIFKAVALAKKAGFKNISIDLIYGIPDKGLKFYKTQLTQALHLPIKHLSFYSLTYEEQTPLWVRLQNRAFSAVSSDKEAEIYTYTVKFLKDKRFFRYEVSNFSKKGFECKHNLFYWRNAPYLGIGASAVTYLGGVRKKYLPDVYQYVDKVKKDNQDELFIEKERLSPIKKAKETASLNIRTNKGINFNYFKTYTGFDFLELGKEALGKLIRARLLTYKKRNSRIYGIKLTNKGFLLCDYVCRQLI